MRVVTIEDVQDTFLGNAAEEAVEAVHPEHGMEIARMLTNIEQLEAMGLGELDQIRITVMVFGAFTAGLLTAKRLMEEEA